MIYNHKETIDKMAISSFYDDMNFDNNVNFDEELELNWFFHWFRIADRYRKNLEQAGLTDEAEVVTSLINDQKESVSLHNHSLL